MAQAGFWSYVHTDDEADQGRITRLAKSIKAEFTMLTGEELEVFVDRESIRWGEEWQRRIDEALEGTAFFMPVVTPRYFKSGACRRELITFAAYAKSLGVEELLLPLLYVAVAGLAVDSEDEAVALIARTQYEDWRELRLVDEESSEYRQAVNRLAQRLVEVSTTAAEAPKPSDDEPGRADEEPPGILDTLAEAEEAMPRWTETTEQLADVLEDVAAASADATEQMAKSDAAGKGAAGRLVASKQLARRLDDPANRILDLATKYANDLVSIDAGVLTLIRRAEETEDPSEIAAACEFFEAIRGLSAIGRQNAEGLAELAETFSESRRYSRDLRSPLDRIGSGLRRVQDGQAIMEEWVRSVDRADVDCPPHSSADSNGSPPDLTQTD